VINTGKGTTPDRSGAERYEQSARHRAQVDRHDRQRDPAPARSQVQIINGRLTTAAMNGGLDGANGSLTYCARQLGMDSPSGAGPTAIGPPQPVPATGLGATIRQHDKPRPTFRSATPTFPCAPRPGSDEVPSHGLNEHIITCLPHLRAFARSLASDRDRADDLVRSTIQLAFMAGAEFTPGRSFKGWSS